VRQWWPKGMQRGGVVGTARLGFTVAACVDKHPGAVLAWRIWGGIMWRLAGGTIRAWLNGNS
jgi:hypothetical protein